MEPINNRYKPKTSQRRQRMMDLNVEHTSNRNELFSNHVPNDSINIQIDEDHFLQNSENSLDDFILQGQSSLLDLKEQRKMLKSARTRALNTANTLGLSTTLINFIERRTRQDWYLFIGLAVATLIFFGWLMS
ncbi:hypothetical protein K502DRAFT_364787 [Neoconidiobolus thromboides FSU 785]|nr:hypothetical protein K502DRAFT_364787 [Neoconidiobolus thromboides FSU 785]